MKIKRSRKKPTTVYAVTYYARFKLSGEMQENTQLLGLYYSRTVAVQDLIAMLNREYNAGVKETEEDLAAWMDRYRKKGMEMNGIQCEWRIEEVNIDDSNKL